MDGSEDDTKTIAHEVGHVLLDAVHVTGDLTQVMADSNVLGNAVGGEKRFAAGPRRFDDPPTTLRQHDRVRHIGALEGLLEPFISP